MGSLASGLPERDRRRVLMLGVGMALAFLITFAVIATQLLKITGLVFAGGLLLLWVAYNMWKELYPSQPVVCDDPDTEEVEGPPRTKTFLQAAIQIAIADLSMSLDNVLLVASIAQREPGPAGDRPHASRCCSWALRPITSPGSSSAITGSIMSASRSSSMSPCGMIYEGWVGGEHVLGLRNAIGLLAGWHGLTATLGDRLA